MKQLWIGIIILALLLGLGVAITWGMAAVHRPMARQLQQAADAAMAEDWAAAAQQAAAALESWKTWRRFTAAFADHTPMEEVDSLFAELAIYARAKDTEHFAATCAHLAQLTEAMADSHSPSWWNLL